MIGEGEGLELVERKMRRKREKMERIRMRMGMEK